MENAILFAPEIVCLIMGLILFFSTVFNASHPTVYALSIFTGVLALAVACRSVLIILASLLV